jgi:2-iminobutanoate/2-iminopropanoate deaminase
MTHKQSISTPDAPKAIGPYAQAIRSGDFLFLSGQIALDPASGNLVEGGVEKQAERVLHNLAAVLGAAGVSFDDVVKTTVYLADMGHFPTVNAVYSRFLPREPFPARATVQVAGLPRGALIEIDAIARLPAR